MSTNFKFSIRATRPECHAKLLGRLRHERRFHNPYSVGFVIEMSNGMLHKWLTRATHSHPKGLLNRSVVSLTRDSATFIKAMVTVHA
jgi:hypothetical protein